MKKFIFTTFLAVFAFGAFAQEQVNQVHKNDGLARWSIGVKGGGDLYRVTPFVSFNPETETRMDQRMKALSWNGGLFLEYNPNPVFGIGISGSYNNYDRYICVDKSEVAGDTKYFGNTIDGLLYSSINISNLVSPQRTGGWKKVSFYIGTGIGGAAYTYKRTEALGYPSDNPNIDEYADRKFSLILMANAGLDFSLCRGLSFMIEPEYRYYNMTNLGGGEVTGFENAATAGTNDAFFVNAGFRWKMGAGKNRQHVRNMTYDEYYAKTIIPQEIDQTIYDRLAALEAENAAMKKDVNNIKSDVDEMKGDIKDIKDALTKMAQKEVVQKVTATAENIEFKTGSAVLTEESKVLLEEVANLLNNIAWIKLDIAGHTDNVGNADKNKKLSQDRADAVKDYLVGKGLDVNKISSVGYGSEKPIASNNTEAGRQRNRRVEFAIK